MIIKPNPISQFEYLVFTQLPPESINGYLNGQFFIMRGNLLNGKCERAYYKNGTWIWENWSTYTGPNMFGGSYRKATLEELEKLDIKE